MDRRSFILAAGGGIAAAAPQAARAAQSEAGVYPLASTYLTNIADVVGGDELPVQPGSPVFLKISPRAYDPHTVLATGEDGRPIGYLPTNQSRMVASILSAGIALQASVSATRVLPRPSVRLDIALIT